MKKLIAILSILLIVMLVSSAFAVSKFPDTVGTKYDAAVEKLTNKKIVDGYDDGTFKPANPVTRAQMCKLIVEGLFSVSLSYLFSLFFFFIFTLSSKHFAETYEKL